MISNIEKNTAKPTGWCDGCQKNVMMLAQRRRTTDVFYEAETPSVPPAASHVPDIPHPISNLPGLIKLFSPAYLPDRFRSPKDLLPGMGPAVASSALNDQSDVLCRSANYCLRASSHCTGYRGV